MSRRTCASTPAAARPTSSASPRPSSRSTTFPSACRRSKAAGVLVNLYLTPADRQRLHTYFDNATGQYVDIPDGDVQDLLFRTNSSENPGTLLIHNNPIANACAPDSVDAKCAKVHAGLLPE